MKNFYFLLLFLFFALKSFSQDPELFNHTWYLEKVVIDNVETFTVSNTEVNQVALIFYEFEIENFETAVCNSLFGELEYIGVDSFTFEFIAQTLIECDLYESAVFEAIYFSFFFSTADETFTYEISTAGNDYFLVITNDDGNQAFYGNQPMMSTDTFMDVDFSFFPNPASDQLTIHLNERQKVDISIFSMNGKLVFNQTLLQIENSLKINSLNKGVYFIVIEDEYGSKQTKKFIKK